MEQREVTDARGEQAKHPTQAEEDQDSEAEGRERQETCLPEAYRERDSKDQADPVQPTEL